MRSHRHSAGYRPLGTLLAGLLLAATSACTVQPYRDRPYEPRPPVQQVPRQVPPARPGPVITPPPARPSVMPEKPRTQRSHPRYAPPPDLPAYWDNQLGVYVVQGRNLYYRERLFYRWDGRWVCSPRANGPWESVAPQSVPPGLRAR